MLALKVLHERVRIPEPLLGAAPLLAPAWAVKAVALTAADQLLLSHEAPVHFRLHPLRELHSAARASERSCDRRRSEPGTGSQLVSWDGPPFSFSFSGEASREELFFSDCFPRSSPSPLWLLFGPAEEAGEVELAVPVLGHVRRRLGLPRLGVPGRVGVRRRDVYGTLYRVLRACGNYVTAAAASPPP